MKELLLKAKLDKKNEFYTQYEDIQNELNHYEDKFRDKTILCNADDPFESNFFKFFIKNFNYLGIKRLICTSYQSSPVAYTIFDYLDDENMKMTNANGYVIDIKEVPMENGRGVSDSDIHKLLTSKRRGVKKLKGDGDFRSDECVKYLKEADIVVTNPPFSLFREYVKQLIEYKKEFLIIGHQNAISYKEIFKLIKENKMWLGYGFKGGAGFFYSPYEDKAKASHHKDGLIRVSGVMWFTNIDIKKRHEDIDLYKKYNKEEYPKYENYDAINVDETKNIPCDYDGIIGVPITFIDKYNPSQFEIVALGIVGSCEFKNERKMEILDKFGNPTGKYTINAKGTLYRKHMKTDKKPAAFKDVKTGELYQSIYARILIKKR